MEEFQFNIDYKNINHIGGIAEFPKDKGLLYIFHANKIPPHIGWSLNNKFYSLKAKGVDLGLDTLKINHIILKKQIPTLIIAIDDIAVDENLINKVFSSYGEGLQIGKTCLNPIDEVFFNEVKHEKIGDLLQTLIENKMNLTFYGLNLPDSFQGIFNYSKNEIEKRIFELQ
jgi:hypothetical protein